MIGYLTALRYIFRIGILFVADVVDISMRSVSTNALGYFYLSGASGHGDAVGISSSATELDDSNFRAHP